MSQIVIEEKVQTRENQLFNNIQRLKREKKEKTKELKEALMANGEYDNLIDRLKELKQSLKEKKEALFSQNADKQTLVDDIKELATEIKNDTAILTDLYLDAYKKDTQLKLFDLEDEKAYFAEPTLNFTNNNN